MPERPDPVVPAPATRRGWLVPAFLLAAIVAIVVACLVLAPRSSEPGESFGGTDSAATTALESRGVEPWFHPLFEPGSSEVESGLFAVQAALGAGLFGYALGNLRGRRVARREVAETPGQTATSGFDAARGSGQVATGSGQVATGSAGGMSAGDEVCGAADRD